MAEVKDTTDNEELEIAASEEEAAEVQKAGALFSPEAVMMLFIAGVIDLIDALIFSVLILDIIAILVIGLWIYFRSQTMKVTRGAAARLGGLAKKTRWLKFVLGAIEFIPVIGMAPLWIVIVFFELRPDIGAKAVQAGELAGKIRKPTPSPKKTP